MANTGQTFFNDSKVSADGGARQQFLDEPNRQMEVDSAACCGTTSGIFSKFRKSRHPQALDLTEGELLIAKEMKNLSLHERNSVYYDVHGVSPAVEETPEIIDRGLQDLEEHIQAIKKKKAYERAFFISPHFVKNVDLRLRFLRAAQWNCVKAAATLVKYLDMKLTLFGDSKLVCPITWEDLEEDVRQSILAGAPLVVVCASGRNVFFEVIANRKYKSTKSHAQALWYANERIKDHPEFQRQGTTVVIVTHASTPAHLYESINVAKWDIFNSIPDRFIGTHFFFEDSRMRPVFSFLLQALPKDLRLRSKNHFGTLLECCYGLQSFGVCPRDLPFDTDGRIRADAVQAVVGEWIQREKRIVAAAEAARPAGCIQSPGPKDVLLGRGWPYPSFAGNKYLSEVIASYKADYDAASTRQEKIDISDRIMAYTKYSGVRFLKRHSDGSWWVEADDTVARQKVAMTFRNLSRRR